MRADKIKECTETDAGFVSVLVSANFNNFKTADEGVDGESF
jgi:hypothetical protein